MYSLTFSVALCCQNATSRSPQSRPPTFHIWRAILRTPPSPGSDRPAVRAHPAECSHYVVISRDGRKLVTRVRVILP